MARLIVKSPYIKCNGSQSATGYMKYIATRERVEILPDDRPPTRKQEQLITKLSKDFPGVKGLLEYEDYAQHPTKANASALITLALEENWSKVSTSEGYAKYIATRPRAQRLGDHGLFGDKDGVDLDRAMAELEHYTGNVWTHIISLRREDATRLGYDNAQAWRSLLRTHRNEIATAMKIPPQDFRWYAAFHDEGEHPHVHMMVWSVKPGQAYLSKDGIKQIKSTLTNQIFKMEQLMEQLAQQLGGVKGKKSYGYLSKPLKKLVDEIVNETERLPVVHRCYQTWWELQCQVNQFYSGQEQQRPPLSQQKEFRAIKNAVIKEAERIRLNRISFEDRGMEDRGGWVADQELPWDCYVLRSIMENEDLSPEERVDAAVQMKRLAQAGDAHAQYLMGLLYRDGGLVIPDTERAQYWMEGAATQNMPAAQYSLGTLLLSDDALVHDPDQGIRWLKTSAQNGNDYAAYVLGKEYLSGRYVFKNTEKAADYLHQAAQEDNPWAQYLLGKLYLMEDGVEQDENTAYQWFQAAAEQGHIYAEFFVERMEQGWTASPQLMLSTTRLLHHMGNIFRDNTPATPTSGGPHIDRKRLQKLRAKKIAQGHKPDDHEEEQQSWGMSMGGW